jgi:hypothetical protein
MLRDICLNENICVDSNCFLHHIYQRDLAVVPDWVRHSAMDVSTAWVSVRVREQATGSVRY